MRTVLKPPYLRAEYNVPSVFLAGSIEMGKATDWQSKVQDALRDFDVDIFNPRRDDWDSSWAQTIDNPQFNEQVTWELNHLDKARVIFMYLEAGTISPISLLELGLYAAQSHMIVVCPTGFWRKGNVDIVCERYHIRVVETLQEGIDILVDDMTFLTGNFQTC